MKKVLFLVSLSCFAQTADPRIGQMLNELASVRPFTQVAISPDAKHAAWIEEQIVNRIDTGKSAIFTLDLKPGATPVRISGTPAAYDRELSWSPDSSKLAFLSDREKKGQMQLYVSASGRSRKLTNLTGYLTSPQWSKDGTKLAVLFAENAPSGGGP